MSSFLNANSRQRQHRGKGVVSLVKHNPALMFRKDRIREKAGSFSLPGTLAGIYTVASIIILGK